MRHSRTLTPGETSLATYCFKDSINCSHVQVIQRMTDGKNHNAWAPFGWIVFPKSDYKEDFIGKNMHQPTTASGTLDLYHDARWFLHELVHVWQYYNGMALVHLAIKGRRQAKKAGVDPYAYSLAGAMYGSSTPDLLDFNIEQQGDIVRDYFAKKLWSDRYTPSYPISAYEAVLQRFLQDPKYPRSTKKAWNARSKIRNVAA